MKRGRVVRSRRGEIGPGSFINLQTGEIVNIATKQRKAKFVKLDNPRFLRAVEVLDKSSIQTLVYMSTQMTYDNLFLGTYANLREYLGMSEKTVTNIMVKLQKNDFVRLVHPSQWMINPDVLNRCNESDFQDIAAKYGRLMSFNTRHEKRKDDNDAL